MKDFWNDRYREEEYVYGTEPNVFFREALDLYEPTGDILMPADGEGRNGVYAAKRGLNVYAFDISEEGRKKAEKLAEQEGVSVRYYVGVFPELPVYRMQFDAAAMIYAHFPPELLVPYYEKIADLLLPGGLVILEGYSRKQADWQKINPTAGGPRDINMLFTTSGIGEIFSGFEILQLEEKEVEQEEGRYHRGKGTVIRFIGRKRAVF